MRFMRASNRFHWQHNDSVGFHLKIAATLSNQWGPLQMSYVSIACLTTAIEQLLTCGIQNIENHADKLANLLIEKAAEIGWIPYRSPDDSTACSHIVSLYHAEQSIEETIKALAIRKIICSSRSGRIRVSIAPYNDENDINTLIQALK